MFESDDKLPVNQTEKMRLEWMINRLEESTNRYITAEKFIIEILDMKWYQRLFLKKKILAFLNGCLTKYHF